MKLTIGMANYADAQGAWWTLSSLRLHHVPLSSKDIELLVVDDMPQANQELQTSCALAKARYIHAPKNLGPAHAKNSVFEHARGEHVLLLDSHVLLGECHIDTLLKLIDSVCIGDDMWVGPLVNEAGEVIATELVPELRGGMLGVWHVRPQMPPWCEVQAHGTAYMCMRRESWPGFSQHFQGFAGEEVYIHEKVRRQGGRVFCHSGLSWCHRFMRFGVAPQYRLTLNDKYRNHLVAAYECGWSVEQMRNYFRRKLPADQAVVVESEVAVVCPDIWTRDCTGAREFRTHD
jgi:glycosyltransferase involved in cell wall biosynthesis